MAATPQSQAIECTNGLINAAHITLQLFNTLLVLQANWTDDQVANYMAQLKTHPLALDGTLITNPDATPNPANPIDPVEYPPLSRAISSNQVEQLKTTLDAIVDYINGKAVAANPGARAILNAAVGG